MNAKKILMMFSLVLMGLEINAVLPSLQIRDNFGNKVAIHFPEAITDYSQITTNDFAKLAEAQLGFPIKLIDKGEDVTNQERYLDLTHTMVYLRDVDRDVAYRAELAARREQEARELEARRAEEARIKSLDEAFMPVLEQYKQSVKTVIDTLNRLHIKGEEENKAAIIVLQDLIMLNNVAISEL